MFFIISLACLGIFILIGAYLLGESRAYSKEIAVKESFTQQENETPNGSDNSKTPLNNSVKVQPTNTANTTTNPTSTTSPNTVTNSATAATPDSVKSQSSSTAPAAAATKTNYSFIPGSKVGDIVKIGDVEMIVTKSTARHKVIEITLKGNTSNQPPVLILTDNNRIVYEIPADVDVNMDVTEKTVVDKSPFYNEQ